MNHIEDDRRGQEPEREYNQHRMNWMSEKLGSTLHDCTSVRVAEPPCTSRQILLALQLIPQDSFPLRIGDHRCSSSPNKLQSRPVEPCASRWPGRVTLGLAHANAMQDNRHDCPDTEGINDLSDECSKA